MLLCVLIRSSVIAVPHPSFSAKYSPWSRMLSSQVSLPICGAVFSSDENCLVFSALRVYAIWNKDWRPLVLVLAIALTVPATNMVGSSW